jgi:hypothetical protein
MRYQHNFEAFSYTIECDRGGWHAAGENVLLQKFMHPSGTYTIDFALGSGEVGRYRVGA